jgi:hypothetical protein
LLIAFMLAPLAYLLDGQKLWAEARRGPGWLATLLGGITGLPALLVPFLLLMTTGMGGGMGMAPEPILMVNEPARLDIAMGIPAVAEAPVQEQAIGENEAAASAQPPRLRQFFPETLYWNPAVLTDESGRAQVDIPMADSITTWRLTALASSQDGRLGFTTQGLRVFQDFFVDVDLPVSLTQGELTWSTSLSGSATRRPATALDRRVSRSPPGVRK